MALSAGLSVDVPETAVAEVSLMVTCSLIHRLVVTMSFGMGISYRAKVCATSAVAKSSKDIPSFLSKKQRKLKQEMDKKCRKLTRINQWFDNRCFIRNRYSLARMILPRRWKAVVAKTLRIFIRACTLGTSIVERFPTLSLTGSHFRGAVGFLAACQLVHMFVSHEKLLRNGSTTTHTVFHVNN